MTTTGNDDDANKSNEPSSTPSSLSDKSKEPYSVTQKAMESIMRISLAGFGGALAGLSLSRQPQQSSSGVRPRRPLKPDSTLPMNWAFACAGFVALIEVSRWASPTSLVTSSRRWITIGDYALGGAAAGAAFRGMQVAQRSTSKANIASGLATGIVLGCLAGLIQCAADVGEEMVEEERQRRLQGVNNNEQDS